MVTAQPPIGSSDVITDAAECCRSRAATLSYGADARDRALH
jgi:hypothetical protein